MEALSNHLSLGIEDDAAHDRVRTGGAKAE
jgi:hypothetical protein